MRVLTIKQLNYAEKLSFWNHEYFQNQKKLLFDTEQLNSIMILSNFENFNKTEYWGKRPLDRNFLYLNEH